MTIPVTAWAQTDIEQIKAVRAASNAALKALDETTNFSYLTDDVLITTGNGTLLSGKAALKSYIENAADSPAMYWIRSSEEIVVNKERGLAWETGIWHGYYADDQEAANPVIQGKYSAMWTQISDIWKIKSQLFVTLE